MMFVVLARYDRYMTWQEIWVLNEGSAKQKAEELKNIYPEVYIKPIKENGLVISSA